MSFIETAQVGPVLNVSLNRIDIHNAFNPKMIEEITGIFKSAEKLNGVRAIYLKGNGKSFCAGADLEWMKEMVKFSKEQNLIDSQKLYDMFEALRNCPLPVVTRAHGSVMGGGLGLVAASDIVAAVDGTKFCFSEAKLGLVPSVISSFVLEKVLVHYAYETMLTAELFTPEKAAKMGLIHFHGTENEVEEYIQARLELLVSNGPEAVRATKKVINFNLRNDQSDIMTETIRVIVERRMSEEGQEGMKSFFEKRSPSWKSNVKKS